MRKTQQSLVLLSLAALLALGCARETELIDEQPYQPERLAELVPLQPGKYHIYQLDSLVFTNFGRNKEVHSYQEKHLVDALITDNLGRPSYRVFRYLRNGDGSGPWTNAGTYMITHTDAAVEWIENNLRSLKLMLPIKKENSWKGNRHMPANAYYPEFSFANDDFPGNWVFTIKNLNESLQLNGKTYSDVVTVVEADNDNVIDTVDVGANAQVTLTDTLEAAWVRGSSSQDTVTLVPVTPSYSGFQFTIYNRSNTVVRINGIAVPQDKGRIYEYSSGKWGFGNGKDSLLSDSPYSSIDYSVNKYAKGVGRVYEEKIMWDFQPASNHPSDGFHSGFGIKRRLIEHN